MTQSNKVIWSEGLFLRPQHMQQQERYFERYVELRAGALSPHAWGFQSLELESDLLAIGKLGIKRARGVFPDGTPFAMPGDDPLPPPLDIEPNWRDQVIHLTLPLRSPTRPDSAWADAGKPGDDALHRFQVRETEVRDASGSTEGLTALEVAGMCTRLVPDAQPAEGLMRIPLARVIECRADRRVVLDEGFMPSAQAVEAADRLVMFLSELLGLLHQRGEALAARVAETDRGGAAEIADFLMLQVINRCQPLVAHLAAAPLLHPEALYRVLVGLAGELATFTAPGKRAPAFAPYRHEQLRESFEPVIAALRVALSAVLEQSAVPIPLQQRKYGVWVGVVPDPTLLDTATFVLAAKADMKAEDMRRQLPAQSKIGPVEKIRDLVNLQLPGIGVSPMAVAPRQLPYTSGFLYFECDRNSSMWRMLKTSGGIAMHFGSGFAGLDLQFWAVRA
ncbi:type VI secretion system baseplate subunit TssK [Burkholderia plantarii]|uniref:type VI secretion system baseplate subunit TssK n=1 Tax=Burkholderia plantarii TaxID=41899 RepID=UPI0006D8ACE6|nr:type VI secretion system baseplate subunit TssK [Burkholderia plantarii]ALK32604.1 type VI secretion protein, VC_A0114 family [Burkholderia plantarii]GLZ19977.1 type VI secretion system-associated protein [Burkholderia plantarii]